MTRILTFLVTSIIVLSTAVPSYSLGIRNHWMVAENSIAAVRDEGRLELARILENHRESLYCGSMTPDFAWATAESLSIMMHSDDWVEAFVEVMRQRISYPYNEQEQREIAFMMGCISHCYGDVVWHGGYDSACFMPMAMQLDNASHEEVELACDIFMLFEENQYPSTQIGRAHV